MTVLECYKAFIQNRRSYCAVDSVAYYEQDMKFFFEFLKGEYGNCDIELSSLPDDIFECYIIYLRSGDRNLKNTSIRTYCRALKAFFRFCKKRNLCSYDYASCVSFPRDDSSVIYPLTTREVQVIDSLLDLRDYCIVHLMLDMGLRLGEVVRLRIMDIHFSDGLLMISDSKYNKSRIVPIPAFLSSSLSDYVDSRQGTDLLDCVFVSRVGSPVTENCIKLMFSRLKRLASIPRIHAHLLRHTFATSYILYGGSIELLRLMMGHSDYNVTMQYLHLANQYYLVDSSVYKIDDVFFRRTLAAGVR